MKRFWVMSLLVAMAAPATAAPKLDGKQPIEISADNLEVLQEQSKAIFSGNVIAKQGSITMRAAQMTVFYEGSAEGEQATGKGIKRIESSGDVVFVSPEETAQGDSAIYDVKADVIDLVGNVTLTRDKNILKGTTLNYNLATGRSILNGGSQPGAKTTSGRVRGLFVPSDSK
jgi:lipopolysaccharide export system protein LptA